jgi:hypothetical protein
MIHELYRVEYKFDSYELAGFLAGWKGVVVSAASDCCTGRPAMPPESLGKLLADAAMAVGRLTGEADLTAMDDRDAVPVMDSLTTMIARLDGLRVEVARVVRMRELYHLRGTRNLISWLRADARLADEAWKICKLAAMAPLVPKVTGLLADGTVSLAQAGTACWQISRLPVIAQPPDEADPPDGPGAPKIPDATNQPQSGLTARDPDYPEGSGDQGERGPGNGDLWAGLWRAGNVHAAADELFSAFMPGLDSQQLRHMGAHLREAADVQERAGDDHSDFQRRGLRISRSLGGVGEITGWLHAEAAEQVIAAFEELGAKTGPDDKRSKPQRWADVLTRLTETAPGQPARPPFPPGPAANPDDDHPCCDTDHTGHAYNEKDHLGRAHGGPEHTVQSHAGPEQPAQARREKGHPGTPQAEQEQTDHSHGRLEPSGQAYEGLEHTGRGEQGLTGEHLNDVDVSGGSDDGYARGSNMGAGAICQRPRLLVTVPLSTLLGQPLAPGATLGSGASIQGEAARRIACDAEIIRLVTDQEAFSASGTAGDATQQLTERMAAAIDQLPPPLGRPSAVLDAGRKHPGWTPCQRDALYAQYGGRCSHPRCSGPIEVIHHIIHWLHGGRTSISNGAPLCKFHHWLVHEGGWRVSKHRDGTITFHPPPSGWRPGTIYRHGKPVTEKSHISGSYRTA